MEDNKNESNAAQEAAQSEGKEPRKVTISRQVAVIFGSKTGSNQAIVYANRDVYSVLDAITSRLSETKSKEELEDILVSIHSIEDPEKSDPLPEGMERWEGEYGVGNVSVEKMSLSDAATELTKAILPGDACMAGVERLAEQFFLRSRMDSMVVVCTFDGIPAVVPLMTSFRDIPEVSLARLYQHLHMQAEYLKAFVEKKFPEKHVDWTGKEEHDRENPVKADTSGIVLPSGAPAEPGERKFMSAKDIIDNSTRIVHLK